jgi:archaemetzincin
MKIAERLTIVGAFGLMVWLLWNMASTSADWYDAQYGHGPSIAEPHDAPLREIETRLRPIAVPKRPPGPGDWLADHAEYGQPFAEYRSLADAGRDPKRKVIYLALIGDFSPEQVRVLDLTCEYMGRFFDAPVRTSRRIALADLPARATRVHPGWGTRQLLAGYVLDELLAPVRQDDALAYLAFTASDLSPREGWNFVFGQASLRDRIGVWSIHRFGDPSRDRAAFQLPPGAR